MNLRRYRLRMHSPFLRSEPLIRESIQVREHVNSWLYPNLRIVRMQLYPRHRRGYRLHRDLRDDNLRLPKTERYQE